MKSFTDNAGRSWDVEVDVTVIKRVARDLVGVDLLEIVEGTLIDKLIRDPILLCDVVYVVCKKQAEERRISDEDFGRAMAGDVIDDATTALLEESVSFCPSPRDRSNLGRVLETTHRMMDKARDLIEQKLDSGELERIAEQSLETAGDSSGNAPESSESIRAP